MRPRLETLSPKKLLGKHLTMSLVANRTGELWRSFMTQRKSILQVVGANLFSLQIYPDSYFAYFDPATEFEKWAAIEVTDFNNLPDSMETLELPGGLYAVFLHKGPASAGPQIFQYIFGTWLPSSAYKLANRPHFELLGPAYKNEDPRSEEEIWIPIDPIDRQAQK